MDGRDASARACIVASSIDYKDGLDGLLKATLGLPAAWNYPLLRSRFAQVLLFTALVSICGTRAVIGLVGTQVYSHDAFAFFDAAWRMLNGQRPHIDFYSDIGVLAHLPTIVGLALSGGTAWGFGYGQALTALVLGTWCYLLSRERLRDVPLCLMCLLVALMAAAPSAIGFTPLRTSPAMFYNRYGYALLAVILIEALLEPKRLVGRVLFMGGLSTGAATAVLLFLKSSYAAAALFVIVMLIECRRQKSDRWAGMLVGAAAITLPVCVYFRFNLAPILDNYRFAGRTRVLLDSRYVVDDIVEHAAVFVAFALISMLLLYLHGQRRSASVIGVASLVTCFAGLVIFTNTEAAGFVLPGFAVIVLLERIETCLPGTRVDRGIQVLHGCVIALAFATIVGPLLSGISSLGSGLYHRSLALQYGRTMSSSTLNGFIPIYEDASYGLLVNDGLALLRANRLPGETIMSLDFSNPFSFALHAKPAKGGTLSLHYGNTLSNLIRPSADGLFGAADLVMVPKVFSDAGSQETVPRLYGPFLKSHFTQIAESEQWWLYRNNRKADRGPSG